MPPPPRPVAVATPAARSAPPAPVALQEVVLTVSSGGRSFERVNETQVRYVPKSRVNPTGGVIPEAMAAATADALDALETRIGDIDMWVGHRLGWTHRQLADRLTSEQIDAVALGIDAIDRKEGLIVADMTGFGKGRILAAISLAAVRSGMPVDFLTEKENLFSDIWRDVVDIEGADAFGRPFMLNKGARIIDTSDPEGPVLEPAWRVSEVDRVIKNGALPEGSRVMLSTYSQFNRQGTPKAALLAGSAKGGLMVLDEAHNFVGTDSATSRTVGAALQDVSGTIFSSATFARNIGNLNSYGSVFPWLRRMGDLNDLTPAQRRAVAEESVRLASGSGRIIRREHDLSTVTLRVVEDTDRLPRNQALHEALAPILSDMARLGSRVFRHLTELNENNKRLCDALPAAERRARRENWYSANFGSRLNAIVSQFLVAIEVDLCVDQCVEALQAGKKPVVVIESTMESLMRELSRDDGTSDVEDAEATPESDDIGTPEEMDETAAEGVTQAPTFRDALLLMADRLLRVGVKRGGEKQVVMLDDPDMLAMHASIRAAAATFPDLSLSPIDDIRDRIEAVGRDRYAQGLIQEPWIADEISARSMRVVDGRYTTIGSVDRNVIVARFNANAVHALLLTAAGSTGLSIHDGPKFSHHAQRVMIELRAPRDVLRRTQTFGRVLRRGQLTEPEFIALSSGLDAQVYEMAASNRKMAELSASVTGTGRSAMGLDVPDPIDAVGNAVAYDLLMDNQHIADAMGISLRVDREAADKELYFVSKFMRRLWLLQPRACQAMFSALISGREERLASGAGLVHDGHDLPGTWERVRREVLERGDGSDDPLDGPDTYVTTIRQWRDVAPVRWPEAIAMARQGAADRDPALVEALKAAVHAALPRSMESVLPKRRFRTIEQALRDGEDNSVKRMKAKAESVLFLLDRARPGVPARLPADDGELRNCLIVGVKLAQPAMALRPRDYTVSYLAPGDTEVRKISFDAIHRLGSELRFGFEEDAERVSSAFDVAPGGRIAVERKIIDGNGLAAVLAARRLNGGTRSSYVDGDGVRSTAILVPRALERSLPAMPGRARGAAEIAAVLEAGGEVSCAAKGTPERALIRRERNGSVQLALPGSRKDSARFLSPALAELFGDMASLSREGSASFPPSMLPAVVTALQTGGCTFQFNGRYRQAVERISPPLPVPAETVTSTESMRALSR